MKTRSALYVGCLFLAILVQGRYAFAHPISCPENPANEVQLHFRFDRSMLDSAYRDNLSAIHQLRSWFASSEAAFEVDSIAVWVYSSMEGTGWHNGRLSRARAQSVKGYLLWKYPLLNQYKIRTYTPGEDWEGLHRLVLASPEVPQRDAVLGLFEAGYSGDELHSRLRNLHGGTPYRYLQNELFPQLRRATVRIYWKDTALYAGSAHGPSAEECARVLSSTVAAEEAREGTSVPPTATTATPAPTPTPTPTPTPALPSAQATQAAPQQPLAAQTTSPRPSSGKADARAKRITENNRSWWAVKTNVLYWAALAPNLELEFYLNRRWSINVEGLCAWWSQPGQNRYYQIGAGGPEVRFRFAGPDRFHGHYVGIYGYGGAYDLENRKTGYQGEFYSAGLTYGYMLPLGRSFGLEFALGLGFLTSNYKTYLPLDGQYVYQQTKRTQYNGVTKAKLGLVWRFGKRGGQP